MLLLATFALPMCLGNTVLDYTPIGYRKVSQSVAVENPGDFEGWQFVVLTAIGPSEVTKIEPMAFFDIASPKYGTRIYAVPSPQADDLAGVRPQEWRDSHEDSPNSRPRLKTNSLLSSSSPIASVRTVLRIESVSEDELLLKWVRESQFDRNGELLSDPDVASASDSSNWLHYLLACSGFGALTVLAIRRKRRSTC
jgi:hypothetical protein